MRAGKWRCKEVSVCGGGVPPPAPSVSNLTQRRLEGLLRAHRRRVYGLGIWRRPQWRSLWLEMQGRKAK